MEDSALNLWVVLARAFDAVERHARASIARFGLGTTEFGVLEALYHKGELPVCEVQRKILVESIFPQHAAVVRRAVGALSAREQAQAARLLRTLGLAAARRLTSLDTHD